MYLYFLDDMSFRPPFGILHGLLIMNHSVSNHPTHPMTPFRHHYPHRAQGAAPLRMSQRPPSRNHWHEPNQTLGGARGDFGVAAAAAAPQSRTTSRKDGAVGRGPAVDRSNASPTKPSGPGDGRYINPLTCSPLPVSDRLQTLLPRPLTAIMSAGNISFDGESRTLPSSAQHRRSHDKPPRPFPTSTSTYQRRTRRPLQTHQLILSRR